MLIDSTHKSWFLTTTALALLSLGVYFWLDARTPGGLTGGSLAGMWFGVAGSGLMIYAGLLSALRRVPSWKWLGPRKRWLRGHIWLGLLSGVLILCHSSFRWGGTLERLLWVVLILVLLTGIYGLIVQQFLPRLLMDRIAVEAPYEQIPHLCGLMRRKADALVEAARGNPQVPDPVKNTLTELHAAHVRPFLAAVYQRSSPLARTLSAEALFGRVRSLPSMAAVAAGLDELQRYCDERRQLGEQERLHAWLHGWLLIHVPLCLVLLVLGVVHVASSLYY